MALYGLDQAIILMCFNAVNLGYFWFIWLYFSAQTVPAQALLTSGCLNGDSIARALVPVLLRKADKLNRGRNKRPGSSCTTPAADVALMQLGFSLGGMLTNSKVQEAFGLSKRCVKTVPNLVTPFTPAFFVAEGTQLVDSIRAAMSILEVEASSAYMVIRDETVWAKSYDLLFGLSLSPAALAGGGGRSGVRIIENL